MNKRVYITLKKFFTHLDHNGAELRATLPSRTIDLSSKSVGRAKDRLTLTKFHSKTEEWTGYLVGLSTVNRTFDFRKIDSPDIISGKFDRQISQDYLEKIERNGVTLGSKFEAKLEITTVKKPTSETTVNYTALDLTER